jgi:hypothetical protein
MLAAPPDSAANSVSAAARTPAGSGGVWAGDSPASAPSATPTKSHDAPYRPTPPSATDYLLGAELLIGYLQAQVERVVRVSCCCRVEGQVLTLHPDLAGDELPQNDAERIDIRFLRKGSGSQRLGGRPRV